MDVITSPKIPHIYGNLSQNHITKCHHLTTLIKMFKQIVTKPETPEFGYILIPHITTSTFWGPDDQSQYPDMT